MKLVKIVPSTNPKKKFDAVFRLDDGEEKIVRFGAAGYTDYILSHNEVKKESYLTRHKHENWNNPMTAGALSRWILWGNSTSLDTNIRSFKRRFHL
jgi:hypothetical protein